MNEQVDNHSSTSEDHFINYNFPCGISPFEFLIWLNERFERDKAFSKVYFDVINKNGAKLTTLNRVKQVDDTHRKFSIQVDGVLLDQTKETSFEGLINFIFLLVSKDLVAVYVKSFYLLLPYTIELFQGILNKWPDTIFTLLPIINEYKKAEWKDQISITDTDVFFQTKKNHLQTSNSIATSDLTITHLVNITKPEGLPKKPKTIKLYKEIYQVIINTQKEYKKSYRSGDTSNPSPTLYDFVDAVKSKLFISKSTKTIEKIKSLGDSGLLK
jgi:hypothetical protein